MLSRTLTEASRPDIPDQFTVTVECNMLETNISILVTEWYDYLSNKARVKQKNQFDFGDFYFDYQNNELLRIDRYDDGEQLV